MTTFMALTTLISATGLYNDDKLTSVIPRMEHHWHASVSCTRFGLCRLYILFGDRAKMHSMFSQRETGQFFKNIWFAENNQFSLSPHPCIAFFGARFIASLSIATLCLKWSQNLHNIWFEKIWHDLIWFEWTNYKAYTCTKLHQHLILEPN